MVGLGSLEIFGVERPEIHEPTIFPCCASLCGSTSWSSLDPNLGGQCAPLLWRIMGLWVSFPWHVSRFFENKKSATFSSVDKPQSRPDI
jgi:hypothetical protein